jgi:hypothetical protein
VKNSIAQKCPTFIIPQYNEFLVIICNISESGDVEFPIFEIVSSSRNFGKMTVLEKVSGFVSFGGITCAPNKYVSLFTIIDKCHMVSCNLNSFEILKFRQGGGIGVFVKNSVSQKCPKFIIPQYNELFII